MDLHWVPYLDDQFSGLARSLFETSHFHPQIDADFLAGNESRLHENSLYGKTGSHFDQLGDSHCRIPANAYDVVKEAVNRLTTENMCPHFDC